MYNIVLTVPDIKRIVGGPAPLATEMVPYINQMAPFYQVNTIDRMAEFLGQLAIESMFQWRNEIWGPTKQQLKYEPSSGSQVAVDLGNTVEGDGKFFMGHGGIQVTGRGNHQAFYDYCLKMFPKLNVPNFMTNPGAIGHGVWWVIAAFWYWDSRKLNALADRRNTTAITKRVNGGRTHLAERKAAVDRARAILTHRYGMEPAEAGLDLVSTGTQKAEPAQAITGSIFPAFDVAATMPTLPSFPLPGIVPGAPVVSDTTGLGPMAPGQVSEALRQVQRLLFAKGYKAVGGADGKWGVNTRDAGLAFRRDNRLPAVSDLDGDGMLGIHEVMDGAFMTALMGAPQREVDPTRAALSSKVIASFVPEVAKARASKLISLVGGGAAGVPAIGGFVWSQIQAFPDLRAKLDPIFQAMSFNIPSWMWMLILAGAMGGTYWMSRGSEKAAVTAYREGERFAQN